MNEPKVDLHFSMPGVRGTLQIETKEACAALLSLASRCTESRIWAIIHLVCEYDNSNEEEKLNIERTILEMLKVDPIL